MASIRGGAMTRSRLVRTFLDSAEFRNRVAAEADHISEGMRVELPTFAIYVREAESAIGRAICEQRVYEPEVQAAFEMVLRPGMTVVDAGCNIGYFTLLAAHKVGESGRVLAFDPSPINCRLLRKSAQENGFPHVHVREQPLGDREARYAFFEQNGNGMLLDLETHPNAAGWDALLTTAILDELLREAGPVHVIKLDVEGAEYRVFRGARRIIETHRPVLITEFAPGALEQVSRVAPETYLEECRALDYRIFILEPDKPPGRFSGDGAEWVRLCRRRKVDHLNLLLAPPWLDAFGAS